MKVFLFGIYSWVTNLVWLILEIMPMFIRNIVFKVMFSKFGKGSMIDYGSYVRYPSRVEVGDNVTINRGCKIFASFFNKDVKIKFGNNIAIAPDVCFFAAGHDYHYYNLPDIAESITVCDNVWICGRSVILPGVTIGEGAVVAASSVVTKDVEPYTIVGGNPASYIKKRELAEGGIKKI